MIDRKNLHIVIVGAGFGGLYAAKELAKNRLPLKITLIDKQNYHLFQPLLYQVATGQLSPENIAYPIRSIFSKYKNVTIIKGTVHEIDKKKNNILVSNFLIEYDYLILATGVQPDYFGNQEWSKYAPGLKTIQDALYMRLRILNIFEQAEKESVRTGNSIPLNFVVIGGGPTGVELCGALAELTKKVMKDDFRNIHSDKANIYLIEATNHILSGFDPALRSAADKSLDRLGVIVKRNFKVTMITGDSVKIESTQGDEIIKSETVLWAAGIKAAYSKDIFIHKEGIEFDRQGRIFVNTDLTIPGTESIYIVGDLAHFPDSKGKPLPGVAPVAMQQGQYVARQIKSKIMGNQEKFFQYQNKGLLAVIGRNAAVADFGLMRVSGFFAWVLWVFVHIGYLIGFQNKLLVLINWAWNYIKQKPSARIVFGCEDKDLNHPIPKCPE